MPQDLYCPKCKNLLSLKDDTYICESCSSLYPVTDGIPCLVTHGAPPDSYDSSLFEYIFETEKKHFLHVGRKEIILNFLQKYVGNTNELSMLEIGCGNGSVLSYLRESGIAVDGADIFLEGLQLCRRRGAIEGLYQVDIMALPFIHSYDVVEALDVLEHIEDDAGALLEMNRALKPGGKLLITIPANKFLWGYWDIMAHHKRRYSRREIVTKLEQNGFTVKRISYYMFFIFPLFAAVRLLGKSFSAGRVEFDIKKSPELKTLPVINEIFLISLRIEKWLMNYVSLPFGASIIILAEKNDTRAE